MSAKAKASVYLVGVVCGAIVGYAVTAAAYEAHRPKAVAPTPPDCAERMNAAARKCNESGIVDFDNIERDDYENANKRILCRRQTREALRP